VSTTSTTRAALFVVSFVVAGGMVVACSSGSNSTNTSTTTSSTTTVTTTTPTTTTTTIPAPPPPPAPPPMECDTFPGRGKQQDPNDPGDPVRTPCDSPIRPLYKFLGAFGGPGGQDACPPEADFVVTHKDKITGTFFSVTCFQTLP
jgi:hypothetical protein